MNTEPAKPWYRHFWVWVMLAPLIAAVIASFITLYLAGPPPVLVNDDNLPPAVLR